MTEAERKMMQKIGATEADFEAKGNTKDRLADIEPVAEMAYINSEIALALIGLEE